MCVVGGGLSQCGEFMLNNLRDKIQVYSLPRAWNATKVVLGQLGGHAGLKGAAALAFTAKL